VAERSVQTLARAFSQPRELSFAAYFKINAGVGRFDIKIDPHRYRELSQLLPHGGFRLIA
jgi:hypothetical protein